MSRNQLRQPETSRNDPQKIAKRPKTTQNFKSGEIWNFYEIFLKAYFEDADFKSDNSFRKFRTYVPKFRHFGPKSINFLILMKFRIFPILNVLISNLALVFENVEPKFPNMGIFGQKASTL